MNKLLPCPFCGGEAEFERMGTPRQSCIVACTDCGGRLEASEEGAACGSQWNDRHVPDGWQVVPVEATSSMEDAGREAGSSAYADYDGIRIVDAWEAMLAAAPKLGGGDE